MKLSAYIMTVDAGFSPNPFGRYCTLACCKPMIRKHAQKGDVVVGTSSSKMPHPGNLIYAMRVAEVVPFDSYWKSPRFAYKKPSSKTAVHRMGDNIWHRDSRNAWQVAPGAAHDEGAAERDTKGENVLIATKFYYFGVDAIPVDEAFAGLLATTQGHRNTHDETRIEAFWNWLEKRAPRRGRIGVPHSFDANGYRLHRCGADDEGDEC